MTSAPKDPQWKLCDEMLKLMKKGLLMPFFGAGVNLANRPPDTAFVPGGAYLPSGAELAEDLLREFEINLAHPCKLPEPLAKDARCMWKEQSLLRVSWYVSAKKGKDNLYHYLHDVFAPPKERNCPPTEVHEFFARFPKRLAEKGYQIPPQLIVTTNYDELLERAFDAEDEPYDVFSYVIDSDSEVGKFMHIPHGGKASVIEKPKKYVPKIKHTIILKIHGTAHPENWENSTFVITEDDYIDYAALISPDKIPLVIANKMLHRRFLYLGYSLSDWNFRVFLRGFKARSKFNDRTWAIMLRYDEWERQYWEEHKVEIVQMSLKDHIEMLNKLVDEMPNVR